MAYFDGIKVGDEIWDFVYGWGTVKAINMEEEYPIIVYFYEIGYRDSYDFNGRTNKYLNQRLFWDKIKFEIPKSPKIKLKEDEFLIQFYHNKVEKLDKPVELGYLKTNGLTRNDKETAIKALRQIKKFMRLLALRDQECPDSRGYEFQYGKENWYIYKQNCESNMERYECYYSERDCLPCCVYFKTERDAQKICNILNKGKFDLEGE